MDINNIFYDYIATILLNNNDTKSAIIKLLNILYENIKQYNELQDEYEELSARIEDILKEDKK